MKNIPTVPEHVRNRHKNHLVKTNGETSLDQFM